MSFTCKNCKLPQPPHSKPNKIVLEKYPTGAVKREEDWCTSCIVSRHSPELEGFNVAFAKVFGGLV